MKALRVVIKGAKSVEKMIVSCSVNGQQQQPPILSKTRQSSTSKNTSSEPQHYISISSNMATKRYRKRKILLATQMKVVVFLLSLLHIGDSPCWIKPTGQIPLLGTVFVMGETTDETEGSKRNSATMRVRAAPDLPPLKKAKKDQKRSLAGWTFQNSEEKKEVKKQLAFSEILKKAGKSGIGGGIPGAVAGVVQVLSLMWLRTIMNYQCRYGSTFFQSIQCLYNQGGVPRFYRGLSFALIQAPLARFVATASNDGVETLLSNLPSTQNWGPGRSTVIASIVVGIWRILLMPFDTCKTVLQVDSVDGFRGLMRKVKAGKIYVLYNGKISMLRRSSLYLHDFDCLRFVIFVSQEQLQMQYQRLHLTTLGSILLEFFQITTFFKT